MAGTDNQMVGILTSSFEQFVCEESIPRIVQCLSILEPNQLWKRPHKNSNSIGHLILHLEGNAKQYILSGVGGAPDHRKRKLEFETTQFLSKAELKSRLERLSKAMKQVLKGLRPEDLITEKKVQIYHMSVMKMMLHVMEHFSYHTGQIVFYTKLLTEADMKFYDDAQLNHP